MKNSGSVGTVWLQVCQVLTPVMVWLIGSCDLLLPSIRGEDGAAHR